MERKNSLLLTEAMLLQQAVASILSKQAQKVFKETNRTLTVKVSPRKDLFG